MIETRKEKKIEESPVNYIEIMIDAKLNINLLFLFYPQ